MLLARTAEAVYWAGRYLERAEDMARLVLVHGDSHVDLPVGQDVGWTPLLAVVGDQRLPEGLSSETDVVEYLLVDAGNPSSVSASLGAARDGFRRARAVMPRQTWELCNDLCRHRDDQRQLVRTRQGRVLWLREVASSCQRLNGTLWATMRRDEALAFARIGQHVERADFTCRVLGARADSLVPEHPGDVYAEVRAMAVLAALDAYQPFRRARPARPGPGSAAAFLLQDAAFPRSVASCVAEVFEELKLLPANEAVLAACAEASLRLSGAAPERMSAAEVRAFSVEMLPVLAAVDEVLAATYFGHEATACAPVAPTPPLRAPVATSGGVMVAAPGVASPTQGAAVFEVVHTTTYRYQEPAEHSYNEAHLRPRSTPRQQCLRHSLEVDPVPDSASEFRDVFGNTVSTFTVSGPFDVLVVTARSQVSLTPSPPPRDLPPWESVRSMLERDRRPQASEARRYRAPSRLVPVAAELAEYAERSFGPNRPVLDAVVDLCGRVHAEFAYEPGFTSVTTPVLEVFRERRGVCQDFAQVFVGCLRSIGLAARYVSGYIESVPPGGASALTDAQASHAWASVFLPGWGWLDVDPTNDVLVSARHVTVAWGRDYWDVSPLRGSVEGGGASHTLEVAVEVTRH